MASGKVGPAEMKQIEASGQPVGAAAVSQKFLGEQELAQLYAKGLDLPFVDLTKFTIPPALLAKVTPELALKYQVVPFNNEGGQVRVALAQPEDKAALEFVHERLGSDSKIHVASAGDIARALGQPAAKPATKPSAKTAKPAANTAGNHDLSVDAIARSINLILEYALRSRASAVHLEPRASEVQVRYRIDGVLHESMKLPKPVLGAVVARIATMAGLSDYAKKPAEGQFNFGHASTTTTVHVSILPIVDGSRVVLQLINQQAKLLPIENLGLGQGALAQVKQELGRSRGLILVVGPISSGVTTTLYSFAAILATTSPGLATVETMVTRHLAGINQTEVGMGRGAVAEGLRVLLRQEPGAIMASDLPDPAAADLATHATATGHLVVAGLHAASAGGAIAQLLNMGLEPYLVATAITLVVGERLVRRLCPVCRVPYQPSVQELAEFGAKDLAEQTVAGMTQNDHHELVITPSHDLEVNKSILDRLARDPGLADRPAGAPPLAETPIAVADAAPAATPAAVASAAPLPPAAAAATGESILERIARDPNIVDRPAGSVELSTAPPPAPPTPAEVEAPTPSVSGFYQPGPGCTQCGPTGYSGQVGIFEVLEVTDPLQKLIASGGEAGEIELAAVNAGMQTLRQDGLAKAAAGITSLAEVQRVTRA